MTTAPECDSLKSPTASATRSWPRRQFRVSPATSAALAGGAAARFSKDPDWTPQLDGAVEVPGIESLSDSAVVIRSLIRTQPGSQWNAAREYRRRLKLRFDRENIEIPFPQRRVHVHVDESASDSRLKAAGAAGG